ncbi:MAG: hypothetical protein ACO1OQ_10985 [Rufibacter sp.]
MKKNILTVMASIALTILSVLSYGQNMGAVNAALAQNHLSFHQQMHMRQMMHLSMANRSSGLINSKGNYVVVMKDSTVKTVYSKIMFDDKKVSYLELEDKSFKKKDPNRIQKIYPSDTRSIKKDYGYGKISTEGLPADSCWLFKTVEGKINGYTFLPVYQTPLHDGYFKFFQKGDGTLQRIEKDSLLLMMGDNEKAKKLVEKEKAYQALVEYNKEPKKAK